MIANFRRIVAVAVLLAVVGAPVQSQDKKSKESTGLVPLNQMSATDRYKGEDGGLYGNGQNAPPAAHRAAAEAELAQIAPLDADGQPAKDGIIGFVSISMSNATQEFSVFKRLADADRQKP